jgi:hypothetical protein
MSAQNKAEVSDVRRQEMQTQKKNLALEALRKFIAAGLGKRGGESRRR